MKDYQQRVMDTEPKDVHLETIEDYREIAKKAQDLRELSIGDLNKLYFAISDVRSELNSLARDLYDALSNVEHVLADALDEQGIDKISTKSGTTALYTELYPKMKNREEFIKWCVANNQTHMVQKRVGKRAFQEYFKNNNIIPDGLEATDVSKIRTRRG